MIALETITVVGRFLGIISSSDDITYWFVAAVLSESTSDFISDVSRVEVR